MREASTGKLRLAETNNIPTTFGVGREAFNNVVSHCPTKHNYQPHDRTLPGPGWYKGSSRNTNKNVSFSMRPRT